MILKVRDDKKVPVDAQTITSESYRHSGWKHLSLHGIQTHFGHFQVICKGNMENVENISMDLHSIYACFFCHLKGLPSRFEGQTV